MKPFPFVLGTDIVQLSRWDALSRPHIVLALARRILHPKEYPNIKKVNFNLFEALLSHGPFQQWHISSRASQQGAELVKKDFMAEAQLFKERLDTTSSARVRNFLAGRWAAKEAARKAWGAHLLGFKDVRVAFDFADKPGDRHDRSGNHETAMPGVKVVCEPYYGAYGPNKEAIDAAPTQEGRLSISHDGDYVVATVIAEPLTEHMRNVFKGRSSTGYPLGQAGVHFDAISRTRGRDQDLDDIEPDLESSEVTEEIPLDKGHQ